MLFTYLSISNMIKILVSFLCVSSFRIDLFSLISFGIVAFISLHFSIVSYFLLFILLVISSVLNNKNIIKAISRITSSIWINIIVNFVLAPFERGSSLDNFSYYLVEILSYTLIILISLLVYKYLFSFVERQGKEYLFSMILMFSFFAYQFYLVSFFSQTYIKKIGLILMLIIISIAFYFLFKIYEKEKKLIFELEKKEIEEKYFLSYIDQTNKEYKDIRKFKHDYINLLSTLEYIMSLEDIEKVKEFYLSYIKPSKEILNNDYSRINSLEKIKIDSLKSILAVKILQAKEKNINVNLEIIDEVSSNTSIKDTILIRVIGIIIDNAIEETSLLNNGEIQIAVFSDKEYIYVIIKNNIRKSIAPLHVLKKEGYSTKGKGRGLGLSNLKNLTECNPNIMLETQIKDDFFTQKVMVKKEEIVK